MVVCDTASVPPHTIRVTRSLAAAPGADAPPRATPQARRAGSRDRLERGRCLFVVRDSRHAGRFGERTLGHNPWLGGPRDPVGVRRPARPILRCVPLYTWPRNLTQTHPVVYVR